jgi:KaiC/GvpD/RAD55 family RecA-like ATPase
LKVLYFHKDFTNNNFGIRKKSVSTELTAKIDIIVGEININVSKVSEKESIDRYTKIFSDVSCNRFDGVILRNKSGAHIFKHIYDNKPLLFDINSICQDGLSIVPDNQYVSIFLYNTPNITKTNGNIHPILILGYDSISFPIVSKMGDTIPIGIRGLEEILFPYCYPDKLPGFIRPTKDNIVPRVILIKGPPGSGKTLLAIKMMIEMLQHQCRIKYFCLNDPKSSILSQALSFNFCTNEAFLQNYITSKALELFDTSPIESALISATDNAKPAAVTTMNVIRNLLGFDSRPDIDQYTKVIFIDSLNASDYTSKEYSHDIRSLIKNLKVNKDSKTDQLSFIILEDPGYAIDEVTSRLISDCEFLSDIVIDMGEDDRYGYQTHYIKINKKHFGAQIYGKHLLKISPPLNPFSNIDSETGPVVYPSIHKYLSRALEDTFSRNNFVHTGISHFDSLLISTNVTNKIDGKSVPQNSCFVIQGPEGGYQLAIGINILIGGLWKIVESIQDSKLTYDIKEGDDVLFISLNEESNIEMFEEAIALRTEQFASKNFHISLDNGRWIDWRYHNATVAIDAFNDILKRNGSVYINPKNVNLVKRYYLRTNKIDEVDIDSFISNFGSLSELIREKFRIKSSSDIWDILSMDPSLTVDANTDNESPFNEKGLIDDHGNVTDKFADTDENYFNDLFAYAETSQPGKCSLVSDKLFNKKIGRILHRTLKGDKHYQFKNNKPTCKCYDYFEFDKNNNKKIIFNKWCAYILDKDGNRKEKCRKMIMASFRPGCITPEQFIFCIEKLLEKGRFTRILFDSTAQLSMKFPLLARDELFVPALVDLFKSKNVISIFIDPKGEGANKQLSYTLSNLADYLVKLKNFEGNNNNSDAINRKIHLPNELRMKEKSQSIKLSEPKDALDSILQNRDVCRWSEMIVENVRGNNYSRIPHAVTVRHNVIKREITIGDFVNKLRVSEKEAKKIWKELVNHDFIYIENNKKFQGYVNSINLSDTDIEIYFKKNICMDHEGKIKPLVKLLRSLRIIKMNELFVVDMKRYSRSIERYVPSSDIAVSINKSGPKYRLFDVSKDGMNVIIKPPFEFPEYKRTNIGFWNKEGDLVPSRITFPIKRQSVSNFKTRS